MFKTTKEKLKWRDYFLRYVATSRQWVAVRPEEIKIAFGTTEAYITLWDTCLLGVSQIDIECDMGGTVIQTDGLILGTPEQETEFDVSTITMAFGDAESREATNEIVKFDLTNVISKLGDGIFLSTNQNINIGLNGNISSGDGISLTYQFDLEVDMVGVLLNGDGITLAPGEDIEIGPSLALTICNTELIEIDETTNFNGYLDLYLSDIYEISATYELEMPDAELEVELLDPVFIEATYGIDADFESGLELGDGDTMSSTFAVEFGVVAVVELEDTEPLDVEPETIQIEFGVALDLADFEAISMEAEEDIEFTTEISNIGSFEPDTLGISGVNIQMAIQTIVTLYRYAIVEDYWNTDVEDIFDTKIEDLTFIQE